MVVSIVMQGARKRSVLMSNDLEFQRQMRAYKSERKLQVSFFDRFILSIMRMLGCWFDACYDCRNYAPASYAAAGA